MLAARDQTEAPNARQADDRIDKTAHPCRVAIEQPRYEIKLEKSPETPIEGADDNQKKSQNA